VTHGGAPTATGGCGRWVTLQHRQLDLLLKYPDATLATYVWRQVKHLRHVSETLAKTPEKHCKTFTTSR
jgi:hypothetical protein